MAIYAAKVRLDQTARDNDCILPFDTIALKYSLDKFLSILGLYSDCPKVFVSGMVHVGFRDWSPSKTCAVEEQR